MKMHAQQYLISDVLKGELGFDGFVVSDWGAIDQITDDYYQAVVMSVNAGIDMNMVPYDYGRFIDTLTEAVESGDVPLERIDDAVKRILTVKYEMGLFDHPFSDPSLLPYTWPLSVDQLPLSTLEESGVEPLFPFSYGLP
jgi:beta-glucosidase